MQPVSKTAFYCCGIRMRDAESARPICGDGYARRCMNAEGLAIFERFGGERGPNLSNVARARYIDDLLRTRLAADPGLQVVLIGCGFDSRAYRLGGGRWLELDEPALIDYKNERLPIAECMNPLRRVAIEFARESLHSRLDGLDPAAATVVIIEGVAMYVSAESLRQTLYVLKATVPRCVVVADLMSRAFIARYGRTIRRIIAELGAEMIPGEAPELPFELAAFRQLSSAEIVALAFQYQGRGWLVPALRLLFPGLFRGYTVRVFEPA